MNDPEVERAAEFLATHAVLLLGLGVAAIVGAVVAIVVAVRARVSLELCTAIYVSALTRHSFVLPIDSTNPYYRGLTTVDYDGRLRRENPKDMLANTGVSLGRGVR